MCLIKNHFFKLQLVISVKVDPVLPACSKRRHSSAHTREASCLYGYLSLLSETVQI